MRCRIVVGSRRRWLHGLSLGCGLAVSDAAPAAETLAGILPAPARSSADLGVSKEPTQSLLYLLLVINGTPGKQPVPIIQKEGHFLIQRDDLRATQLPIPTDGDALIALDSLAGIEVEYNALSQQLHLRVPPDWLPKQTIGGAPFLPRLPAQGSAGALFNYDVYLSSPKEAADSVAIWTEQRLFGSAGVLSNTGTYRRTFGDDGSSLRSGYLRYDTQWRWNDEDRMIAYQIGDLISDSLTWSHSVRMGGLRISRNFSVRPDLITYPTLTINGSSEVPSTVELFVNGYKANSGQLQSGPYTIANVPLLNGAGQATVVTTDALGRQVSTTVPFYVANALLSPGLSDFDLSIGALRRRYGVESADYGEAAFSALYRRGLTSWLTLSGHVEAARELWLAGIGSDTAVGRYGTLSVAASHSHYQHRAGWRYVGGYSYRSSLFSIDLQHSQRDPGFVDLSELVSVAAQSRKASQATLSFSPFGPGKGSPSLGYYAITTADNQRTRLLSLSFSRPLFGNASIYLSLARDIDEGGTSGYLQLLIPLQARQGNVGLSYRRSAAGGQNSQVSWSRSAPSEGGWGWNLSQSDNDRYHQASLTWLNDTLRVQGGTYGGNDDRTYWGDISGSLVLMDGALFASNRITDAFVLVSTGGYADVPVRYENRLIGRTNRNGHLLVPSVASYYPAKYSIDTLQLPVDVQADRVEDRLAVREGNGALLRFNVAQMRAAAVQIMPGDGHPLPAGREARHRETGQISLTGYDNLVYFENIGSDNHIDIQIDDQRRCSVHFTLREDQRGIQKIGPLPCDEENPL